MCFYADCVCRFVFFFFKQKTAYEMRISDWSSDVCSSDLDHRGDAARCSSASSAVHGLLVLLARLADLHAHVDQARRQAGAAAAAPLHALRLAFLEAVRPAVGALAVFGEQTARRVEAARRTQKAGVDVKLDSPPAREQGG